MNNKNQYSLPRRENNYLSCYKWKLNMVSEQVLEREKFLLPSSMAATSSVLSKYPYPSSLNIGNFVSLKLTQANYPSWRAQMLGLIESQDLQGFIDGEYSMPSPTIFAPEAESADGKKEVANPDFAQWRKSDRLLRGWIIGTLSEEVLTHVVGMNTSREGAVYWKPPEQALEKVKQIAWESSTSRYGTHEGLPELKEALIKKLREENKLYKSSVMVTAGSNQGFLNLVLTLCDVTDSVILFAPYFFNAYMSFQMTGINNILVGPSDPKTLQPDADWLERILFETKPVPKLVSIVNPGNPSGTCIREHLLKRISDICRRAGTWLVVDNAYEYFMYDGMKHSCVEGDHVINLFSFSKAYGMMGWRVGYIAYSSEVEDLRTQLLKVQDNVAICASMISQQVALQCLEAGGNWVRNQVKSLVKNKDILIESLAVLGEDSVIGGEGAIYLWAKLPKKYPNDFEVVCWLARRHGVVMLPGSASGGPGCVRITYGALTEAECEVAAKRLRRGLEELVRDGMVE